VPFRGEKPQIVMKNVLAWRAGGALTGGGRP
jgi:hypothetical protein